MPISGLPKTLELVLQSIVTDNELCSYKIVSNKFGASTVVLRFSTISLHDTAHELRPCRSTVNKPETVSKIDQQDQLTRTHLVSQNKKIDNSLHSTPTTHNQPTSSSLNTVVCTSKSSDPDLSSNDSGVDVNPPFIPDNSSVTPDRVNDEEQRVTSTHSPRKQCVSSEVSNNQSPPSTPPSTLVSCTQTQDETKTGKKRQKKHVCPDSVVQKDRIKTEPNKQPKTADMCLLFKNKDLYERAKNYSKRIPRQVKDQVIKDPNKSPSLARVHHCGYSDEDGGRASMAFTDELIFIYFHETKTVGRIILRTGPDDRQNYTFWEDELDRWPYTRDMDSLRPGDLDDITQASKDILNFILDH